MTSAESEAGQASVAGPLVAGSTATTPRSSLVGVDASAPGEDSDDASGAGKASSGAFVGEVANDVGEEVGALFFGDISRCNFGGEHT